MLLEINNLSVKIDNKNILKNIDLKITPGSTHALMGPNGSGKSTLAYSILGHPSCEVISGNIRFKDQDITDLSIDKRAKLGIFLAFQYPKAVPGLKVFNFLKAAYESFNSASLSLVEFKELLLSSIKILGFDESLLERDLNDGFSGGEKKRLEMLQLYLLNPKIAIIDEIDSGLDVDALKIVSSVLNKCKERDPEFSILLVTHYRRILEHLKPDYVHILNNGTLDLTGDYSLALKIDQVGYQDQNFKQKQA